MTPDEPPLALLRSYAPDPQPYAALDRIKWMDEIDLAVGPAHVRMGTRSLPDENWLPPDAFAPTEVALRRRLLDEQRASVFACTARAEEPAAEAAALIDRWRARYAPCPQPSGEAHPLARAGVDGPEDLCLMVRHHGAWHLEGALLCFPSLWVLSEKLGQPTSVVHAPVPHYAEELSAKVDTFFDRMAVGRLVWRRNFSLWPELLLWAPRHSLGPEQATQSTPPQSRWIRSERQTLYRLPATKAILFTIRVQMAPLGALAHHPGRAAELADWLGSPAGETRRQQMGPASKETIRWLDQISGRTGEA